MLLEKTFDEKVFSNLISHATAALRLSEEQVKTKYSLYPNCFIEYSEDEKKERAIEVRFDHAEATMLCLFNAEKQCDSIFVYPDYLNCLTDCVNYLNALYEYDYIRSRWVLPCGYLLVDLSQDDTCFAIHN